jgi:predicted lactoylglutathione lyase
MSIGAFSISLSVKDIKVSKAFYEKLGFKDLYGDIDQNWLIMKNGDCAIVLFQEMFDKNILTFNPGWNNNAEKIESFKDVRVLQEELREKGIQFQSEVDLSSKGPGSFLIEDPDGNQILVDQHV